MSRKKPYTTGRLLVDIALTFFTGGLWLIVIFIRFMRTNS
jgi:hypothetical protein